MQIMIYYNIKHSPLCDIKFDAFNLLAVIDVDYGVVSVHHVGILCENLERSLEFYQNVLGMLLFYANV